MNQFYDKGLDRFATGDIDWINNLIYVSLLYGSEYTPDIEVDEFYSDIPVEAIASSILLDGRTTNKQGVMDGEDITFPSVPGDGKEATLIVIWREIGHNNLLSPLIAKVDEATEFPVVPDGNDISFTWDNGVNKILTLKIT